MAKHQQMTPIATSAVAMILSRNLSYAQRAQFVTFAKNATVGHWAEVIDVMQRELCIEHRCPFDGEPETHR